jgi:hypothetical protein
MNENETGKQDRKRMKWLVGIGVIGTFFTMFACVGVLALGMMFSMGGRTGALPHDVPRYVSPPPADAAPPLDDQPRAQVVPPAYNQRGYGHGYDYRYDNGGHRSMGFGIFGLIGSMFHLLFTIAFVALLIGIARRFLFGRGWRYGMAGGPGGRFREEPPAWVEQWHSKLHERMDRKAEPPAAESVQTPEPPVTDTDPADTPQRKDDNPSQAI